VTSTSESSNTNAKEEPGSDAPAQMLTEPPQSATSGTDSNEESNQIIAAPAPPGEAPAQTPQDQQQEFFGAILNGLMGGQQLLAITPVAGLPAGSIELLAAGLQTLVSSQNQQQQQNQASSTGQQQQQQQLQSSQTTSNQQQLSQPQMGQSVPNAQQQLQQQLQQLPLLLQQEAPQQLQQMLVPQQLQAQQQVFNMAFPLLLQSLMQTGQIPQTQQNTLEQQMQQVFSAAASFSVGSGQSVPQSQGSSQYIQGQSQGMGQAQQGQDQSQHTQRAVLPEAELPSSDRNSYPLYMPRDKDCLSSYQCFLR
jgi:hypothetical protein